MIQVQFTVTFVRFLIYERLLAGLYTIAGTDRVTKTRDQFDIGHDQFLGQKIVVIVGPGMFSTEM